MSKLGQLRSLFILFIVFGSAVLHPQSQPKPAEQSSDSQKSPEFVYRTTTRLVILDLVATDAQGKIVADLRPEEVEVLENGKEQTKVDFSFIHPNPEEAAQQVALHLPADVYTNARQYKGNSSYNVILFDVLNSSFTSMAYAHDQMLKYLDETPPNQPTAIYALGNKLWLLHDFTTDHQALKEVIKKFKGQGSQIIVAEDDSGHKRKATFGTAGADRVWTTLDAFKSLARIMGAYKGRKNLIWLSESFVIDTMPDMNTVTRGPLYMSEYSRELEEMSDALMEAQIAIYPIEPGGLSGESFRPLLSNFNSQSSLREMAERTGGKAFINRNDIDTGIRSSIDDGSSYYTTSYHPANKTWDGRLRKIEVKTTRAGVKLRYREGYYAVDPSILPSTKKEVKQTSIDFAQALDPDLPPSTAMLFQARVQPPSDKTHNQVVVNFAVDPKTVLFQKKEDGLQHAEVSCIAWAFPVKGKPIGSGGGTVNAKLDAETFNKVMQSALPCNQTLTLSPGNYMLRLGVIDQYTKKIGALTAWVNVPEQVSSSSGDPAPQGTQGTKETTQR
jgi:VWFA-related protein